MIGIMSVKVIVLGDYPTRTGTSSVLSSHAHMLDGWVAVYG